MLSVLLLLSALAAGKDLVWTILTPEEDARDAGMVEFDRKMDEHLVATINTTDELRDRLQVKAHELGQLGSSRSAFASLHFDPTKPSELNEAEKKALELYLARGGFLLLVEDNYPYSQAEFRRPSRVAVFDYLTRELPARNPDFRATQAGQSHPVFHQLFQVEIPPAILRETFENAYSGAR